MPDQHLTHVQHQRQSEPIIRRRHPRISRVLVVHHRLRGQPAPRLRAGDATVGHLWTCASAPVGVPATTRRRRLSYGPVVAEDSDGDPRTAEKAERQAARELVKRYHRTELSKLLDHVREGFTRLDSGEIDEFELDDLIHQYKKAAANLWSFCGSSGNQRVQAANALRRLEDLGEPIPDWWEEAAPRR